jgi:hypothetical protein
MAASGRRVTVQRTRPSPWAGFQELGPEEPLCEDGLRGHLLEAAAEAVRLAAEGGRPSCTADDAIAALSIAERVREVR